MEKNGRSCDTVKVTVKQHEAKVVYVAPINEATKKWGVCAIPRMWRLPDGALVYRVNGEQDSLSEGRREQAVNLFFLSRDNGETWELCPDGEEKYDIEVFGAHVPPYTPLADGTWIARRMNTDTNVPVHGATPRKELVGLSREHIWHTYRFSELPEDVRSLSLLRYDSDGRLLSRERLTLDIPEFEPYVIAYAQYRDGKETLASYEPATEKFHCMSNLSIGLELPDGTLLGTVYGQEPDVDRMWSVVYLAASEDGGRTWKKRGEIGVYDPELEVGYTYENRITLAPDGSLLAVMRTEACVPRELQHWTPTMFSRSEDGGYTWSRPVPIADSSVTPHIVTLKNGVVVFVYGRPGVHFMYSTDSGKTWSKPVTVIGRTLTEHLEAGEDYMDAKYWDMDTYANTYVEIADEESILLCYQDMKFDPGDGEKHKASLVKRISFHIT